jgi:hypothetical protein
MPEHSHRYFVSYACWKNGVLGFGRSDIRRTAPITNIDDIESIEEMIVLQGHSEGSRLIVLNWKRWESENALPTEADQ